MAQKKLELLGERVYAIVFWRWGRMVKQLRYKHLDRACRNAFGHVDQNRYHASRAEVVHLEKGHVYLTIYITPEGNIYSFYDPKYSKTKLKDHLQTLAPEPGEMASATP